MPRFFLNLHDDLEVEDLEGREFADLYAAREAAIGDARSILAEDVVRREKSLSPFDRNPG